MSSGRSRRNKRRRAEHEEEHEDSERWAVSYADMMTVLVGLFIVLYAMSQVDEAKYEELRNSLSMALGHPAVSIIDGSNGAMSGDASFEIVPDVAGDAGFDPELVPPIDGDFSEEQANLQTAMNEYARLQGLADRISAALAKEGLDDRVRYRISDRGLAIGMVADDVFFAADTAHLTETARTVIDTIGPVLVDIEDDIAVEGHANVLPSTRYATNWELSSDRATQVLRRLVEAGGVPAGRIGATGFGAARPLEEAGGITALDSNRRVDLIILSGLPDDIRSLLPSIAAAAAAEQE